MEREGRTHLIDPELFKSEREGDLVITKSIARAFGRGMNKALEVHSDLSTNTISYVIKQGDSKIYKKGSLQKAIEKYNEIR